MVFLQVSTTIRQRLHLDKCSSNSTRNSGLSAPSRYPDNSSIMLVHFTLFHSAENIGSASAATSSAHEAAATSPRAPKDAARPRSLRWTFLRCPEVGKRF